MPGMSTSTSITKATKSPTGASLRMVSTRTRLTAQNMNKPAATMTAWRMKTLHTLPSVPDCAIDDDSTMTRPMPVNSAVIASSTW